MEVKIKQGKEMIDATIEVIDGVMVVSPKEVFEPKDGDVIVCRDSFGYWTLIVKKIEAHDIVCYHAVLLDNGILKINDRFLYSNPRPATEEEQKKLFDKLAEEGYSWDAERKELVKIKWKPKVGDTYFRPDFNRCMFMCYEGKCRYDTMRYIKDCVEKGWCFKTKQECEEFCNRLNDVISQVNHKSNNHGKENN